VTKRERSDVATMEHFAPPANITEEDREAVARHSSRGELPPLTEGVRALRVGKTFRDSHIATWRRDVADGILTMNELLEDPSFPEPVRRHIARFLGRSDDRRPAM
jgi:hypothetical protein